MPNDTKVSAPPREAMLVKVTEPVNDMLEQCLASGLFGDTLEEVIDRMLCAELVRLIGAGFINVDHAAPEEAGGAGPRELGEGARRQA